VGAEDTHCVPRSCQAVVASIMQHSAMWPQWKLTAGLAAVALVVGLFGWWATGQPTPFIAACVGVVIGSALTLASHRVARGRGE